MRLERLQAPDVHVIVSLSGGKDSTATALHLRELGVPFAAVFADTGWESDVTYAYIDEVLVPAIGPITTVRAEVPVRPEHAAIVAGIEEILGRPSPMVRRCVLHATYPRRTLRWCTSELKLAPIRSFYHQHDGTVVSVVGVRAAESAARAELPEWEIGDPIDAIVWRPLIAWSDADVFAILRRHGVAPNPLYLQGCHRVGCWPCIHARKEDYAVLRHDVRRVAALRALEAALGDLAEARAEADGTTLAAKGHRRPTWHYGWPAGGGPLPLMPPIDDVLAWASTDRSGQTLMFHEDTIAREGCMRWGLCEASP